MGDEVSLLFCPFCGGSHAVVEPYETPAGTRWRVACPECGGRMDGGTHQRGWKAAEAWNRRATPKRSEAAPKCDATERGIDSIYDWCFAHLEGSDGAEDALLCAIMGAIEDYRHPERAEARTARAVDRGALLELADDMDRVRGRCDFCGEKDDCDWAHEAMCLEDRIEEYARRIREACGEAGR